MEKAKYNILEVLKERADKLEALKEDALNEAKRLAMLLKEHYKFEKLYICGSLLSSRFYPYSDIDMVIKGLKMGDFFKAYAFLIKKGGYRIDLKPFEDLKEGFRERVLREGLRIG
ncbi:MAG: nucleotidyltransferase domain-containing protein [bacterium]